MWRAYSCHIDYSIKNFHDSDNIFNYFFFIFEKNKIYNENI